MLDLMNYFALICVLAYWLQKLTSLKPLKSKLVAPTVSTRTSIPLFNISYSFWSFVKKFMPNKEVNFVGKFQTREINAE